MSGFRTSGLVHMNNFAIVLSDKKLALNIFHLALTIKPTNSNSLQELNVTQTNQSGTLIYTHPDCAYSAAAKMEYRRNKVEYIEVNVAKEADKIPDLLELTNGERVTPVIV